MFDPVVLLTPLLVFAVILLLGFVGCLDKPPRPEPGHLSIQVRVPVSLTVTSIGFRANPPDGPATMEERTNPPPDSTDGGDNVFEWTNGDTAEGAWVVRALVEVRDGTGATGLADADGFPIIEDSNMAVTAKFQAIGTPSGGDFQVAFQGVT